MENKTVYLYSPRSKPAGDMLAESGFEILTGNGEEFNWEYLSRCRYLLSGRAYITSQVLDRAPELRLICKQGVGLDRIDLSACRERGIEVMNTPGSNSTAVAEHTMALMLACAKRLWPISKSIRCGESEPRCAERYRAGELAGKTLSLIGLGSIGSKVAKMAAAFGMRIVACVRHPERYSGSGAELAASLDRALAEGDYVSLHVSGTEENRGLIGSRELGLMKPGAVLINTTRGFVIDEKALYEALAGGRLAGAGLDVFEDEPLRAGNPLLELDNVFATPHSAANTPEANLRAFRQCAENILRHAKEHE